VTAVPAHISTVRNIDGWSATSMPPKMETGCAPASEL
jgi:hypothetical protein